MNPISVLHVVPYFPPDRLGGVGEVAAHVHRELVDRGHRSHVVTSGSSHDDPTVTRVAATPGRFTLRSWAAADAVAGVDVIHAHQGEGLGLLLAARRRWPNVPILVTFHVGYAQIADSFRPYRIEGTNLGSHEPALAKRFVTAPVHRVLDRVAQRMADQLSFISESARCDVVGADAGDAWPVIYNGLPDAPDLVHPAPPTDLLYVGTLGRRKRVRTLPLVLERVKRSVPSASLRVVGFELDEDTELRRMFAERDLLDSVVVEGRIRSEQIAQFYAAAKVLVVPSAYEGLPMVILEAGQHGLPCVATNVSGHPEVIVDGENGYLVPRDDPEAMAERVVRLLERPPLQRRMSLAAVAAIDERFSVKYQVDRYVELYGEMMAGSR